MFLTGCSRCLSSLKKAHQLLSLLFLISRNKAAKPNTWLNSDHTGLNSSKPTTLRLCWNISWETSLACIKGIRLQSLRLMKSLILIYWKLRQKRLTMPFVSSTLMSMSTLRRLWIMKNRLRENQQWRRRLKLRKVVFSVVREWELMRRREEVEQERPHKCMSKKNTTLESIEFTEESERPQPISLAQEWKSKMQWVQEDERKMR